METREKIVQFHLAPEESTNQGYHYNGSPKFFVRAGDAFAEALYEMIQ